MGGGEGVPASQEKLRHWKEKESLLPSLSYRNHSQCKSVENILVRTQVPLPSAAPWGQGEQLRTGTFKVKDPKKTKAPGCGGPNWCSSLPYFIQVA